MPKPKAEMMKRLRDERINNGLIEIRAWINPSTKERIMKYIKRLNKSK